MAREMKVGLLIGVGMILLMGIIVSDYLSVKPKSMPTAAWTNFGNSAQDSIYSPPSDGQADGGAQRVARGNTDGVNGDHRFTGRALPTPHEMQQNNGSSQGQSPQHTSVDPQQSQGVGVMVLGGGNKPAKQTHRAAISQPQQVQNPQIPLPQPRTGGATKTVQLTSGDIIHEVKQGESLYQIAKHYYNNGGYWKSIRDANPNKVSKTGTVRAGVKLVIPNRAGLAKAGGGEHTVSVSTTTAVNTGRSASHYTVKPGDSLYKIAKQTMGSGAKWKALYKANRDLIKSPSNVPVGAVLTIPGS